MEVRVNEGSGGAARKSVRVRDQEGVLGEERHKKAPLVIDLTDNEEEEEVMEEEESEITSEAVEPVVNVEQSLPTGSRTRLTDIGRYHPLYLSLSLSTLFDLCCYFLTAPLSLSLLSFEVVGVASIAIAGFGIMLGSSAV